MNTVSVRTIMVLLGTLFYVQAWFNVAEHDYAQALIGGLIMFTMFIGASHLDAHEDFC